MSAFLAVWLAVVVLTLVLMARLGHSWFFWGVLSAALGPLAWPLAIREVVAARRKIVDPPPDADVLVAVAPWIRSPEQILTAVSQVDPAPEAVTLATVLDAEDATTPAGRTTAEAAEELLERCRGDLQAEGLAAGIVECRLLYGRAADELARLAHAGRFRRIVLGPSGSRAHHLLRGHTRARLAQLTSIPVVELARPGAVA